MTLAARATIARRALTHTHLALRPVTRRSRSIECRCVRKRRLVNRSIKTRLLLMLQAFDAERRQRSRLIARCVEP